ncbi:hypothetical protein L218DRAFT_998047 [Marasmius fiardii PR-910]|nr:hypothetical protein L218DRAFT_998047 [Marasmius fiardii PR-910]
MALSLPRSVVSSKTSISAGTAMARKSPNPLLITPSLTAPNNSEPNVNTLSDEYLILTRKRHSDFSSYSIRTDHRHAGQFSRWKEWNLKNQSLVKTKMINTGDFLVAEPAATAEFPRVVQSDSRATKANAGLELLESRIFKLQLLESLSSSQDDPSLGYRCKLVSIGDVVLPDTHTPSKLYVKLYDDRFFPAPGAQGSAWYQSEDKHSSAESYIRSELVAYEAGRLGRSWKCHGAFKFVLSRNGHWLNGLLWEDLKQ